MEAGQRRRRHGSTAAVEPDGQPPAAFGQKAAQAAAGRWFRCHGEVGTEAEADGRWAQ